MSFIKILEPQHFLEMNTTGARYFEFLKSKKVFIIYPVLFIIYPVLYIRYYISGIILIRYYYISGIIKSTKKARFGNAKTRDIL